MEAAALKSDEVRISFQQNISHVIANNISLHCILKAKYFLNSFFSSILQMGRVWGFSRLLFLMKYFMAKTIAGIKQLATSLCSFCI